MTRFDAASRGFLCAGSLCLLVALPASATPTFQDQVMELVNVQRWDNGQLAPLKRNTLLEAAGYTHCQNMAVRDFFAHCDLDTKTSPWDRINAAGYTGWNSAGENIAAGYSSAADVMSAWMNSSGHRANILGTTFRELGIGYYYQAGDQANVRVDSNGDCTVDGTGYGPFGHYWCQDFGRKAAVYPVIVNREAYETVNSTVALYVYGQGWAQQMRFRNEAGEWSDWQTYATDVSWVLSPGNGVKTVTGEIRNGTTVYSNTDDIVLNASADLAVTMTADPEPVIAGHDLTWRAIVTNNGASTATGVSLTDVLPAGVTFVSCSHGGTVTEGTLSCNLGTMAPGAVDTVEIVVQPAAPGSLQNSVTAGASEYDPVGANNSASTTTTVEADPTGVGEEPLAARALTFQRAVPNPFARTTQLSWYQPEPARVLLTIHDPAGRRVAVLVDAERPAGEHAVSWDGCDGRGARLAAGVYFARIESADRVQTQKILLAR